MTVKRTRVINDTTEEILIACRKINFINNNFFMAIIIYYLLFIV